MNWSSLTHRQVPAWGFFQVFCFGWGFNICMFKCLGLPWGSDSKESACNAGDPGSIPESVRFVWRSKWLPTPAFLPGKSHGQRSLVGYSPCGHKGSDTTERLTLKRLSHWFFLTKTPKFIQKAWVSHLLYISRLRLIYRTYIQDVQCLCSAH